MSSKAADRNLIRDCSNVVRQIDEQKVKELVGDKFSPDKFGGQ